MALSCHPTLSLPSSVSYTYEHLERHVGTGEAQAHSCKHSQACVLCKLEMSVHYIKKRNSQLKNHELRKMSYEYSKEEK